MSEKLKPCPFCGTEEGLYPSHYWPGGGKPYAIDCIGCGMDFTPREGMDVVAAWNRRDLDAAKGAEIAKLREENDRLREALDECEDYFDNRADADCDQDGFIPNKEMQLLTTVRAALTKEPTP